MAQRIKSENVAQIKNRITLTKFIIIDSGNSFAIIIKDSENNISKVKQRLLHILFASVFNVILNMMLESHRGQIFFQGE